MRGGGQDEDAQKLQVSARSSNLDLVKTENIIVNFFDSAGDAEKGSMTITPIPNQSGLTTITIEVNDGELITEESFSLKVLPVNDPPRIGKIEDQVISEDGTLIDLTFEVGKGGGLTEAVQILQLSAESSNTSLITNDNIIIEFEDGQEDPNLASIIIKPKENEFGQTTITITADDGIGKTHSTFKVAVNAMNDPPTLSDYTRPIYNRRHWSFGN